MSRKRTTAEELTPSSSMRAEVAVTCSSVVHGDDSTRTAGLRQMMVSILILSRGAFLESPDN